ncbi:hypothetical protein Pryu01_01020 [Paraliobacillus ryukyuensis]|uniref:Uncharacterized protein n=1 Tax=Paraliobacillus ryukyuensis TaxID=200904 RepID=A0A366EDL9_9BACI|nr:hypothetical protein DES48_102170 [Paraliobacillus ryukyuensis]
MLILSLENGAGTKLIFNYSIRMIDKNLTIATGNTLAFYGHGLGHTGRDGFRLTSSRFTKWIFGSWDCDYSSHRKHTLFQLESRIFPVT